jgi:Tol biopolymer transport system component
VRLTSGQDTSPFWAPNGRWLAFERTVYDEHELAILDVTTGRIRVYRTAFGSNNGFPDDAAWSPDSEALAWFDIGSNQVRVFDMGQSAVRRVRTFSRSEDPTGVLAWSPDGKQLAVATQDDSSLKAISGTDVTKVLVLNVSNGRILSTVRANGELSAISWPPSGPYFYGVFSKPVGTDVMDSSGNTRLLSKYGFSIQSLSPARQTAALVPGNAATIYLIDLQSQYLWTLDKSNQPEFSLGWSADGQYLAFIRQTGQHSTLAGPFDLYVADVGTGTERRVAHNVVATASTPWYP